MSDRQIKLSDNVLMQKVADEAVLLDLDSQSYFGLDPVGTVIWEAITEKKSENDIVHRITEAFDVDADTARSDLRKFLKKLHQDKLIDIE
jgi:hypothetical protein